MTGSETSSSVRPEASAIPPGQIGKQLDALFGSFEQSETTYRRCASGNVLHLVHGRAAMRESENIVATLSNLRPSRFFRICIDDTVKVMEISVSARCHRLSQHEQACTEVVEIALPPGRFSIVPSVLRANLVGGAPTAVLLTDAAMTRAGLSELVSIADELIVDSGLLEGRTDLMGDVSRLTIPVIDLEWVALGTWREQIRVLADRPEGMAVLPGLEEVEIRTSSAQSPLRWGISALILSGWIIHALALNPAPLKTDRAVCSPRPGSRGPAKARPHGEVLIKFSAGVTRDPPLVVGITLRAMDGTEIVVERRSAGSRTTLESTIRRRRGTHADVLFRATRSLEPTSQNELLERYFLVGESLTNYQPALKIALALAKRG